jgi:hypothetical protein
MFFSNWLENALILIGSEKKLIWNVLKFSISSAAILDCDQFGPWNENINYRMSFKFFVCVGHKNLFLVLMAFLKICT